MNGDTLCHPMNGDTVIRWMVTRMVTLCLLWCHPMLSSLENTNSPQQKN